MCYGFDAERPLERSLAQRGSTRRNVLRGAVATAAAGAVGAAGLAAAGPAAAHGKKPEKPSGRPLVPPGLISIQIYSLRSDLNGEPGFDATMREIAKIGYPRIEQAVGYFGRTAKELRRFYDRLGIRATSSHEGISADNTALDTKIANAKALGQSYINVPYLASDSADEWKRWADRMNHEAARAKKAGLKYGYHNHAHEFTTDLGRGRTPWSILTERLDRRLVHLEIDLYWAVTGGIESGDGLRDPEGFALDVIRSAPQKTLQYHVKDRHPETGDFADLGTGFIDFPRIFRAHSVQEYIVENDSPDVTPIQTAKVGYRYLRSSKCRR
ncbi:sugar phosphate isomerase/epimerase family protein [Streptomyces otsuchiensis]|uniref:sugar phosphate isomerase/epimerase family protein n=1 Tax=Streptomyces otsuchiensis TaxID=2681388 RepID=UPI00103126F5|nr:sugar phosphate isomerase/epimerase [Streptomyces otsuchiensis]